MYCDYFRLSEPPFSLTPDPRYFFMSARHREGLAHLVYGVRQSGGFVQLTGDIGCGKTTLCRYLVTQLPAETDLALILNPRLTALELLAVFCDELGIPYPAGTGSNKILVDALNQRLLEAHAKGRRTVLIIDEAQNLRTDVLEQIRLLTNLETSKEKLLQIILIGQPELLRVLRRKKLLQLSQRITARYHLLPLSRRETYAYIRHRLSIAGCSSPLFTAPAMRHVYRLSRGVPRLINIICDRALLGSYARDKRRVSAGIVLRASRETQGLVPWYRRLSAAWAAGVIGLAVLIVGGALFLTTANQFVRREAAAGAAIGRNGVRVLEAESTPAHPATPGDPLVVRGADQAPVKGNPGPVTASSLGIEDPQARNGGVSIFSPLHPGTVADALKADVVKHQMGGGSAGAVPSGPRLADILADPSLRGTSGSSFTSLCARLGIEVPSNLSDPGCEVGHNQGFECLFRVGNWTKLRYYDLPAILDVTLPSGLRRRVALIGLGEESATLAIGGWEYTFPLPEIDKVWDGSFILLWKLPFTSREITLGANGEDVIWVRRALDTLEGKAPDPSPSDLYDESLRSRVLAFQRDRSLPQDGVVGAATLVRLTLALLGPNAPSISHHAPKRS